MFLLTRFLWAAVIAGALAGRLPQARAQQPVDPGPAVSSVVLLLAPGASLSDWTGTAVPALRRLLGTARFGVVPTGPAQTSLEDACRSLAYGTRSPGPDDRPLGDVLAGSGVRVVAVADRYASNDAAARIVAGSGAAFANVPAWRVPQAQAPDGRATDPRKLADAVCAVLRPGRRVLAVVLFDDMARTDRSAPLALPEAVRAQRRDALRRLDDLLRALTRADADRRPDALLVVTPQPSFEAVRRGERLGPILLWRRRASSSDEGGLLTSPSTRRTPGLAASEDVAATVAGLLGSNAAWVGPGTGRVLEAAVPRRGDGAAARAFLGRRVAAWAAQVREQRLLVAVPWLLACMLLVAGALGRRDARGKRGVAALGLWAASVPLSLLTAAPLAPIGVEQAWVVYALALGLSLAAPLLFWGFPHLGAPRLLQSVAALTTIALLLDPWLGAPLLSRSPLSYSVVEAARYYGMGNEAAGVFLGASLVTAAALLFSPRGVFSAVLLAVVATATLALPRLGADFGGLIAALAGFGTLLFVPAGGAGRAQRRRAGGVLLITALVLAAAVVAWDAARPAGERTHVGQAVARVMHAENGPGTLRVIAARKTATAARLLVTSPWSLLLLAEIAVLFWRRERAALRPTESLALFAAAAAALLVNDSGVVAAAACLLYGAAARLTGEGAEPNP